MKLKKMAAMVVTSVMVSATSLAAPFGGEEDVSYAADIWASMSTAGLAGKGATMSTPYIGMHPHGAILDTIDTRLKVGDNDDILIIKRNYGGEGVSKTAVANDPDKYLKAVTVMYKRKGFDADIKDWFWIKYAPDGSVLKNPKGVSLAGRVGKGMAKGCVACHTGAPGGDMVFNHDRYAK
ncbi:MAG: cytochrome P460 family protein [Candidatus Thiodiazotropha sp. (ex Ustalcina ferruginea)]|nr:cytochrome P460 family protein [Candidatus Thiodiazotropha sp. (ex Ustalcina ferruginea)]